MNKRFFIYITVFVLCVLQGHISVFASTYYTEQYDVPLRARTAILIEESTGKILYAKDENLRVYPASITKLLTVMVALEHLDLQDFVTVGDEIETIGVGSSTANNEIGEVMTVENMMRLIIIPSGNETSCVAARAVAVKVTGNPDLPYADAERVFTELMNEKARSLGAINSFFVNPHGYHHNDHYTTAYDMALICRAAIQNDFIRQVIRERVFSGTAAPPDGSRYVIDHHFVTHNELINPDSPFFYPYATGMKTGFTDQAGECLAASATHNDINLIALIFDSPGDVGGRWLDAKELFEFGFNNFSFETVHTPDEIIDSIPLTNPKLGEDEYLDVLTTGYYEDFLTKPDLNEIKREIIYSERYITPEHRKDKEREDIYDLTQFTAPIENGAVVGKVVYTLRDEIIYESELIAARGVEERTKDSDYEYYEKVIKENIFTIRALPYWCALFALLFIIVQIALFIRRRKRNKNQKYRLRSRHYY